MTRLIAVVLLLLVSSPCWSQKHALASLMGKVVTQRRFVDGAELLYDEQGHPAKDSTCTWTVCARILVTKANAHGNRLEIEGDRQLYVFDKQAHRFVEVMEIINGPKSVRQRFFGGDFDHDRIKEIHRLKGVRITIERAPRWDESSAIDALTRIFLKPSESLVDVAGPEWRSALCKQPDFSSSATCSAQPARDELPPGVFKVGGDVKTPRAITASDPEFSEMARTFNYSAEIAMCLIVGPDGRPGPIQIINPAGLGLDEQGVRVIKLWMFHPGTKSGEPVAVQITVDMSFRLY